MWSLGVTTYVLLTGFSPFGGETDQETFCNISRGELDLPEELFEDVSQDALDFINALLVKDPKSRLSAAACLRHPWLSKKEKKNTETPQPLLRHDSDPITAEEIHIKSTRTGCQACPPKPEPCQHNPQSLRKYLSKSREALFEKVIQQQKSYNNLRKSTLKNQLFNRTRLCESQISLVSKSREKLMNGENQMSPSFSRSIEKIYGLRSLSKSQEVLNLYKNGGILASQENLNLVSEMIIKSRENISESLEASEEKARKDKIPELMSKFTDINELGSLKNLHEDLEKCDNDNKKDKRYLTRATTADLGMLRHIRHRHPRMYGGSSTTSISSSIGTDIDIEELENECDEDNEAGKCLEVNINDNKNIIEKGNLYSNPDDKNQVEKRESLEDLLKKAKEICTKEDLIEKINDDGSDEMKNYQQRKCENLEERLENLKEKFEKISKKLEKVKSTDEDAADEPRFTVAQLISAYNKHQEIVTRTSLEVTMTAQDKEDKIPPLIEYKSKSTFPTGPTALRLFIPDIDLVEIPQKKKPGYKIRFSEEKQSDSSGPNSGDWNKTSDCSETNEAKEMKTPESSGPNSGDFEVVESKKEKEEATELVHKYLRSSSMSSEASTTISTEGSNITTGSSSWEELSLSGQSHREKKDKNLKYLVKPLFLEQPFDIKKDKYTGQRLGLKLDEKSRTPSWEEMGIDFEKLKEKWTPKEENKAGASEITEKIEPDKDQSEDLSKTPAKPPTNSKNLAVTLKSRSKSTSPSPMSGVKESEKVTKVRKLSAGSNVSSSEKEIRKNDLLVKTEDSKKNGRKTSATERSDNSTLTTSRKSSAGQEKSPNSLRKTSVEKQTPKLSVGDKNPKSTKQPKTENGNRKSLTAEKSPNPSRKFSSTSSNFKIIGISDKSPNVYRKNYGISYKIEFDSPVTSRKFPLKPRQSSGNDLSSKTTVSSELKKQEAKKNK